MGTQKCNQCGKCCANVLMLSKREIDKIKKYIKKNNISVINRNNVFLEEDVNICPFLSEDNKCNIYEVRPSICRSFNCNPEFDKTMDYKGVKAINMLLTFGPKDTFSVQAPDLTSINEHIKELQNKIQKGR